jgi:hypothetical protein
VNWLHQRFKKDLAGRIEDCAFQRSKLEGLRDDNEAARSSSRLQSGVRPDLGQLSGGRTNSARRACNDA